MTPALLSTRKDEGGLKIETDPNASGAFSDMSSLNTMALPPGTVSPQGMGGFPVPINNSYSGVSRNSSMSSYSSSGVQNGTYMGTSDMLAIAAAAAPPPTMDQVTDATRSSLTINVDAAHYNSLTVSASPANQYSIGNSPMSQNGYQQHRASMPPQYVNPPPPANGMYQRSASAVSAVSYDGDGSTIASYASAPTMPMAPAPSAPPPPAPGSGGFPMYGGAPAPNMYGAAPAPMPPYATQVPGAPSPYQQWSQQSPTNQFGAPPPLANAPNPYHYGR